MRILCLSNMYPGPGNPDYGAFIERMCDSMERQGAEVDRVVIRTRSSGRLRTPAKYLGLSARAVAAARRADVIWAHYLFPTGLMASLVTLVAGVLLGLAGAAGALVSSRWRQLPPLLPLPVQLPPTPPTT